MIKRCLCRSDTELYSVYRCNAGCLQRKGSAPALVKAENASEDDFADYIKNITSVKVNGKEYAATGNGK